MDGHKECLHTYVDIHERRYLYEQAARSANCEYRQDCESHAMRNTKKRAKQTPSFCFTRLIFTFSTYH